MGLAAGQARLLTITGRKADCEFQSMRLSHQKITLARELAEISNEYQNSLDQTKLVYDYYGTGDTSTPLSYGIMMTPSVLNDFKPILLTDSIGRSVLNSQYAAAARAAGIPQEGFGTLPSEAVRNAFVSALCNNGLITSQLATTIKSLPYNQAAGCGGGTTVAAVTKDMTLDDLCKYLADFSVDPTSTFANKDYVDGVTLYDMDSKKYYNNSTISSTQGAGKGDWRISSYVSESTGKMGLGTINLGDILDGDYILVSQTKDEMNSTLGHIGGALDALVQSEFWQTMFDTMESALGLGDGYTEQALAYARNEIEKLVLIEDPTKIIGSHQTKSGDSKGEKKQYNEQLKNLIYIGASTNKKNDGTVVDGVIKWADQNKDGYIGYTLWSNTDSGHDNHNSCMSAISVNLSSVFKAYLTHFVDYMNGIATTDVFGAQKYEVGKQLGTSKLVDNNTVFTVRTGTDISSDDLVQATFYDTLFNQICMHGWVENNNVMDNEYLKEMLQTGKMFISKQKEDNYYYQANYATDSYIKEIPDESFIAQAEAKYNTEKAKLNAKEETLDLKMKNLDTEISSLTTEYDTVKNTISKNIEKSFKRYDA